MELSSKLFIAFFLYAIFLLFPITSSAISSDFLSPKQGWSEIKSDGHTGEQKLLAINNGNKNDKIYLYWMAPGATSIIQKHSTSEEVVIVQGSLAWLNEDKSIQRILKVGDYIDRKPGINHGPFKSGKDGCLMYVKFH